MPNGNGNIYKTPSGDYVPESDLKAKYGDRFSSLVSNGTLSLPTENLYKTPNGAVVGMSALTEKYGDRLNTLIDGGQLTQYYSIPVKKKEPTLSNQPVAPSTPGLQEPGIQFQGQPQGSTPGLNPSQQPSVFDALGSTALKEGIEDFVKPGTGELSQTTENILSQPTTPLSVKTGADRIAEITSEVADHENKLIDQWKQQELSKGMKSEEELNKLLSSKYYRDEIVEKMSASPEKQAAEEQKNAINTALLDSGVDPNFVFSLNKDEIASIISGNEIDADGIAGWDFLASDKPQIDTEGESFYADRTDLLNLAAEYPLHPDVGIGKLNSIKPGYATDFFDRRFQDLKYMTSSLNDKWASFNQKMEAYKQAPTEEARLALEEERKELLKQEKFVSFASDKLENLQGKYNEGLAKYVASEEKKGNTLGLVTGQFIKGIQNTGKMALSLGAEAMPYLFPENSSGPSVRDEMWMKETGNTYEDLQAKETSRFLQDVYGKMNDFASLGTTDEYVASEDRSDFVKALSSVAESFGTAVSGAGSPMLQKAAFFAQSYNAMEEQMSGKEFDGLSQFEKKLISVPYSMVTSALEKVGFDYSTGRGKIAANWILNKVAKGLPKDATEQTINRYINDSVTNAIKAGIIRVGVGAAGEGLTEAVQAVSDAGMKEAANILADHEYFKDVPKDMNELVSSVAENAYYGALAGMIMSAPGAASNAIVSGYDKNKSNIEFDLFYSTVTDPKMREAAINGIKTKVMKGEMTVEEMAQQVESMDQAASILQSMPDGFNTTERREAFDLMVEKNKIQESIKGKDPSFTNRERARISEINTELSQLGDSFNERVDAESNFDKAIENANIINDDSGDTEYKIDGGFYSEEQFSDMLDSSEFISAVASGDVAVEIKNPSEAINAKLNPQVEEAVDQDGAEKDTVEDQVPATEEAAGQEEADARNLPMEVEHNWSSGKTYEAQEGETTQDVQNRFIQENKESIIDDYLNNNEKGSKNLVDPDAIREYFAEIGYDGKNVPEYGAAGWELANEILDRAMARAEENGNKTIAILTGTGGSGKTRATNEATAELDLDKMGVTLDGAFNNYEDLNNKIKYAEEKGFDVEVVPVYNDPVTAFANTVDRGKRKDRFLSLNYFLSSFLRNKGKIESLLENNRNVKLVPVDNSGNQRTFVTPEQATEWNYEPTDQDIVDLLKVVADDQELTRDQVASVAEGLDGIKEHVENWTSEMEGLVSRIKERVQQTQRSDSGEVQGEVRGEYVDQKTEPAPAKEKPAKVKPKKAVYEPKGKIVKDRGGKIGPTAISTVKKIAPESSRQAILSQFVKGLKLTKEDIRREVAKGPKELSERKRLYSAKEGKSIDDTIEILRGEHPDIFDTMEDQDIRNEIIDVLNMHNTPTSMAEELVSEYSVGDVLYELEEDRIGAKEFERGQEGLEEEVYIEEARREAEEAEMSEEEISNREAALNEELENLTDEELEQKYGRIEPAGTIDEDVTGGEGEVAQDQGDTGSEATIEPGEEITPPSEGAQEQKEDGGKKTRTTRAFKRSMLNELDPETKAKLDKIGQYDVLDTKQYSKYINELVDLLGIDGAIEYAYTLNDTISDGSALKKKYTLMTAGSMKLQEAQAAKQKAIEDGDLSAQAKAENEIEIAYLAIRDASMLGTKAGQMNSVDAELHKQFPSLYMINALNSLEKAEALDDNTKFIDAKGNPISVQQAIDNLRKDLTEKIRKEIEAEIGSRVGELEAEIEKLKSSPAVQTATKKRQIKKSIDNKWQKFKAAGNKPSDTLNASILPFKLLNQEQVELLASIIADYARLGGLTASHIVSTVTREAKRNGVKGINKNHVEIIARQVAEYNEVLASEANRIAQEGGITEEEAAQVVSGIESLTGQKITDIIKDHYVNRRNVAKSLAESLIEGANVDPETARNIAASIESMLSERIEARVKSELNKFLLSSDKEITAEEAEARKVNRRLVTKIVKAINMGALSNGEEFERAFEDKFGFKKIDPQSRARMMSIIEQLTVMENNNTKEVEVDGETVVLNTTKREDMLKLQREFNTLLDASTPLNYALVLKEINGAIYISILSNVTSTSFKALVGSAGGAAFGIASETLKNPIASFLGMAAATKSIGTSLSRAGRALRTGVVEVGKTKTMGEFSSDKQNRIEKALFKNIRSAMKDGGMKDAAIAIYGTTLKNVRILAAMDAFLVSQAGIYYNAIANAKMKPVKGSIDEKMKNNNMDIVYNEIASSEFSDMKADIERSVDLDIKKGIVDVNSRLSEVNRRLRQNIGSARFSNPKTSYLRKRMQELRENQAYESFQKGWSMGQYFSLVGAPDGYVGMATGRLQKALDIRKDDSIATASGKFVGNMLMKFVNLMGNFFNATASSIPVVGIGHAFLGAGYNPVTGEYDTNFFKGKWRSNRPLLYTRLTTNLMITTAITALIMDQFEYDEEEDEWKLDPDRTFDFRGSGFEGMGGYAKNKRLAENYEPFSFSWTKDENGNFSNYHTFNQYIPQLNAIVATMGAFTDDAKKMKSSSKIDYRRRNPFIGYSKQILDQNFKGFTEGSFNSIGRAVKPFMYEETFLEGLSTFGTNLIADNASPLLKPNAHVSVANYIKSAMGVAKSQPNGIAERMLQNMYGLDALILDEKKDVFGNPYPQPNDIERFVTEVPKMSELYPRTTGILFKFPERGANISKWRAAEMKPYSEGFSLYGEKYRVYDESIREEAISRQEELFNEFVQNNYDWLNRLGTVEDLEEELLILQREAKTMAKEEVVNKYLDVNDKNAKIVLVE